MTFLNIHSARHRFVLLFALGAVFSIWLVTSVPPFKAPASSQPSSSLPKLSSVHGMIDDPEWSAEQEQVLRGSTSQASDGIAGRIGNAWKSVGDRLRPYVGAGRGSQQQVSQDDLDDDDDLDYMSSSGEGSEIKRELRQWLRKRSREVGQRCREDASRWEDEYG